MIGILEMEMAEARTVKLKRGTHELQISQLSFIAHALNYVEMARILDCYPETMEIW